MRHSIPWNFTVDSLKSTPYKLHGCIFMQHIHLLLSQNVLIYSSPRGPELFPLLSTESFICYVGFHLFFHLSSCSPCYILTVLFSILVILLILLGLAVLVFYAVFEPRMPVYSVQNVRIAELNVTNRDGGPI